MSYESALLWFGATTVILLFVEINFTYLTQGFGFGFSSNRKDDAAFSPLAGRIKRTYQNQVESAAYIVPVLGAAALMGLESNGAEIAALLIVLGRAAFAPLYFSGVPFIRVPAFGLAAVSTIYIAVVMLTQSGA